MNRTRFDLVIFDCDGVLVDSEAISNEVLAEILCRHGGAFTSETALAAFVGHSVQGIRETAKAAYGIDLRKTGTRTITPRCSQRWRSG